ncbi:MAG: glycosyltransferase family 10 [Candidatus Babeliales bacterium]
MNNKIRVLVFLAFFTVVGTEKVFYFNLSDEILNIPNYPCRDNGWKMFYDFAQAIKNLGYHPSCLELSDYNDDNCIGAFFLNTPNVDLLPKTLQEKSIFGVFEPPLIAPGMYSFDYRPYCKKILYLSDAMIDNDKALKFFYPQPSLEIEKDIPSFDQKKLCTMIVSYKMSGGVGQLYSARREVINFFEKKSKRRKKFDFYGEGGWPASQFKTFKGKVPHKRPVLKNYKFCICYENCNNVPGYITEKIFDCLVSGCVPVYWGAENITDCVWPSCFIDRRKFKNNRELYKFMKKMKKEEYDQYIKNIKAYLKSEMAFLFSTEYFIDTVLSLTIPDYKRELIFTPEQIAMLEKAYSYYKTITH